MTDQAETVVESPVVEQPAGNEERPPLNSPEEMRQSLHKTLHDAYVFLLTQIVFKLPINPHMKQNAITRFDEGLMWARDAINLIDFNALAEQMAAAEAEAKANAEAATEVAPAEEAPAEAAPVEPDPA